MSTTNIHLLQFKIQSHLQICGLWMPLHQKSTRRKISLKFQTLHLPFCIFLIKILITKLPSWVYFEVYTSLDETIRCTSKWFILTKECNNATFQVCYLHTSHSSALKRTVWKVCRPFHVSYIQAMNSYWKKGVTHLHWITRNTTWLVISEHFRENCKPNRNWTSLLKSLNCQLFLQK